MLQYPGNNYSSFIPEGLDKVLIAFKIRVNGYKKFDKSSTLKAFYLYKVLTILSVYKTYFAVVLKLRLLALR